MVHSDIENRPVAFLKNPQNYLKLMSSELGYDDCHKIEGIDASVCAKDCEKLAESEFAKNCTKSNGLFKCCIR